ncbi:MAG: bifunctional UDP-N-acetylglucosamine diphosphorylase/glucosamine-1-phosphate N-acetyltransferase GlmU [Bdellovibrionota bacterium]
MTQTSKDATEARPLSVIILAAGKGTRMKSPLPKVLHPAAGTPIIKKVIDAVKGAGATEIRVVVGHGEALVRKVVEPMGVVCYPQQNQWGTADAVKAADPGTLKGDVLILAGDHPLIEPSDIEFILKEFKERGCDLAVVSTVVKNPGKFGRIVRHKGELRAIVEAADAGADALKINEINTGIYVMTVDTLNDYLPRIQNHNSKKEYYLTDIVSITQEVGDKVDAIKVRQSVGFGVNTQEELARATRKLFQRKNLALMEEGVLMIDPKTTYVEDEVTVGPGSVLYPGVYLRGRTKIGAYCMIEPGCYLAHTLLEDGVHVKAYSYFENTVVRAKATLGPFTRLRPETEIGPEAHVGNFVEMKKVKFGARSKAGHLSYLGDATVGEDVNIGCGTITCNYAADKQKYRTVIGDRVFVGSDTQFIAPIEIGADSFIGSGSTITKDVPAKALAVARGKQIIKENWTPKAPGSATSKDGETGKA